MRWLTPSISRRSSLRTVVDIAAGGWSSQASLLAEARESLACPE
jgi:hypothetical protein